MMRFENYILRICKIVKVFFFIIYKGLSNTPMLNSVNINKKTINNNNPSAVHIFRFFNFLSGIIKLIYQSKIIRKLEINILLNN